MYLFCTQFSLKLTKCLINVYILTPHDLSAAFLLVAFRELWFLLSGQNDFPTEQYFGAWELFCLSVLLGRVVPTSWDSATQHFRKSLQSIRPFDFFCFDCTMCWTWFLVPMHLVKSPSDLKCIHANCARLYSQNLHACLIFLPLEHQCSSWKCLQVFFNFLHFSSQLATTHTCKCKNMQKYVIFLLV